MWRNFACDILAVVEGHRFAKRLSTSFRFRCAKIQILLSFELRPVKTLICSQITVALELFFDKNQTNIQSINQSI